MRSGSWTTFAAYRRYSTKRKRRVTGSDVPTPDVHYDDGGGPLGPYAANVECNRVKRVLGRANWLLRYLHGYTKSASSIARRRQPMLRVFGFGWWSFTEFG
jgi:hypothetical protein